MTKIDEKRTIELRTLSEIQEDIRTLTRVSSEFIHAKLDELANEIGEFVNSQWIPVTERLPEEDAMYLVTFKNGIKVCMVGYGSCKKTVLGYPIGHGWYSLEEAQYYAEDSIIAWMPLSEPYKED